MDIAVIGLIVAVFLGLASVAVTHVYHKQNKRNLEQANKELQALVAKLPDEIVGILKEEVGQKLTVGELNELIYRKTIDEEALDEGDPFPYAACPRCGSRHLSRTSTIRHDDLYYLIQCNECRWAEVSQ